MYNGAVRVVTSKRRAERRGGTHRERRREGEKGTKRDGIWETWNSTIISNNIIDLLTLLITTFHKYTMHDNIHRWQNINVPSFARSSVHAHTRARERTLSLAMHWKINNKQANETKRFRKRNILKTLIVTFKFNGRRECALELNVSACVCSRLRVCVFVCVPHGYVCYESVLKYRRISPRLPTLFY